MGLFDLFQPNVPKLLKKRNEKGLFKALQHAKLEIRIAAAEALNEFNFPISVDPLIAALRDSDNNVRQLAGKALVKSMRCWFDTSLSICNYDAKRFSGALQMFKYSQDKFAAALGDSDVAVRNTVARLLLDYCDAIVSSMVAYLKDDYLSSSFNSEDKEGFASVASHFFANIGTGMGTVAPLIVALKDSDVVVRKMAAHTLGEIGYFAQQAVEQLTAAVKDSDVNMRRVAFDALKKISFDCYKKGDSSAMTAMFRIYPDVLVDELGELLKDTPQLLQVLTAKLQDSRADWLTRIDDVLGSLDSLVEDTDLRGKIGKALKTCRKLAALSVDMVAAFQDTNQPVRQTIAGSVPEMGSKM